MIERMVGLDMSVEPDGRVTLSIHVRTQQEFETITRAVPDLLATLRDGMTAADVVAVETQLKNISVRLRAIARPPGPGSPGFLVSSRGPVMAVPQSTSALITAINDDTNQLATVVIDLRSQISVGMSQADVDAVNAQLTNIGDHLKAIAADPQNLVPTPTPAPATAPKTSKP